VLLVALFPEVQDKIVSELQMVFKSAEEEATDDQLKQLTHLEMVIKEAMRFWPIAVVIGRQVSDDIVIGKFDV